MRAVVLVVASVVSACALDRTGYQSAPGGPETGVGPRDGRADGPGIDAGPSVVPESDGGLGPRDLGPVGPVDLGPRPDARPADPPDMRPPDRPDVRLDLSRGAEAAYLPRFAPYFERPCLRPSTPMESSVPRMTW